MVGPAIFAIVFFAIVALVWVLGSFAGRPEYKRVGAAKQSGQSADSGTHHHA